MKHGKKRLLHYLLSSCWPDAAGAVEVAEVTPLEKQTPTPRKAEKPRLCINSNGP